MGYFEKLPNAKYDPESGTFIYNGFKISLQGYDRLYVEQEEGPNSPAMTFYATDHTFYVDDTAYTVTARNGRLIISD